MRRILAYLPLLVVLFGVLSVVLLLIPGRRVSGVFSTINSGLSPNGFGVGAPDRAMPAGAPALSAPESALPASGAPASDTADLQRLVIKTADLSLTVENVAQAEASVRGLATRLGGYVVAAQTSGSGDNEVSRLTFRVPAARFDDALSGVQGLAKEITQRTIGGDDVTEEFVDLESRLENLEATRDRLLTFLDKAARVEDALSVNRSLTEVQGEIEQIRGRMQFLQQSAALSTIAVSLSPLPVTPIAPEQAWQPLEVARGALRNLVAVGQGLANVLIVLLVWTPLWLPLALAGRWAARRLRHPA